MLFASTFTVFIIIIIIINLYAAKLFAASFSSIIQALCKLNEQISFTTIFLFALEQF